MNCRSNTIADFTADEYRQCAVVALGSNLPSRLGEPVDNIRLACEQLRPLSIDEPLLSSLWQTEPLDCPPGSQPFVNAVALLLPLPAVTASQLLQVLQDIEVAFGRQRNGILNAPRPLDLDLIAFGCERLTDPVLTLPHPRAHERRFVLEPLAEIAPAYCLPGFQATVTELLDGLAEQGRMLRLSR